MSEVNITLTLSESSVNITDDRSIKVDLLPKSGGADITSESDPPIKGFDFSSDPIVLEPSKDAVLNIRVTDHTDDYNKLIENIKVTGTLTNATFSVENGIVILKTTKWNLDRDNDQKLGLLTFSSGDKTRRMQITQKKDSLLMEKAPLGGEDLSGVDETGITFKRYNHYYDLFTDIREFVINIKFKAIKMKYFNSGFIEYSTYDQPFDEYDFIYTVTNSGWFKVTDIKDHYIVFKDVIAYEGQLLGRVTGSYIEFKFQSIPYSKILNIARYSFNGTSVNTSKNYVDQMDNHFETIYWASGTSSEKEGPDAHIEGTGYDPAERNSQKNATEELYIVVHIDTDNTNMRADRDLKVTKYVQ